MVPKKSALAAVVALQVALATSARAQSPGSNNKVTAEALFESGRQLVASGKYAEACPKFADSQRLDPSTATLLNLASCWEKVGRTATAWATYREAQSAAHAAGRQDYFATAERHANALAQKLARITIRVPEGADGIQIERDGLVVERAEWGLALPVDIGAHVIAAAAPGRKAWTSTVEVTQDGAALTVAVPALDPLLVDSSPAPSTPTPPPMTAQGPAQPALLVGDTAGPPKESRASGSSQRAVAGVIGGLGIVGLAVSAGLAVVAKNKYNDSVPNCPSADHRMCNPQGLQQRGDALSAGDAATVAFGLGAAALVAGGLLWFTAPRGVGSASGRTGIALSPTIGGAVLRATW